MKRAIQSTLFIAMFIVALAMGGSEEFAGIIGSLAVFALIAVAMYKAGMVARPLTKEEVEKYYYKK